ncbi:hypothetical protein ACFLWF_00875 [Chloroflexota bacterium]
MIGLPKETILSMLKKELPSSYTQHGSIEKQLTDNIAEVISANNEAIMFGLKTVQDIPSESISGKRQALSSEGVGFGRTLSNGEIEE